MREGSGRAGKGCEAKERACGGPCFTNCSLRGTNRGMRKREKKNECRPATDCAQQEIYSGPSSSCVMHTQVDTLMQTQMIPVQLHSSCLPPSTLTGCKVLQHHA